MRKVRSHTADAVAASKMDKRMVVNMLKCYIPPPDGRMGTLRPSLSEFFPVIQHVLYLKPSMHSLNCCSFSADLSLLRLQPSSLLYRKVVALHSSPQFVLQQRPSPLMSCQNTHAASWQFRNTILRLLVIDISRWCGAIRQRL